MALDPGSTEYQTRLAELRQKKGAFERSITVTPDILVTAIIEDNVWRVIQKLAKNFDRVDVELRNWVCEAVVFYSGMEYKEAVVAVKKVAGGGISRIEPWDPGEYNEAVMVTLKQ